MPYDDCFSNDPSRTIYTRGLQKKVNHQACRKASGIVDTETTGESIILVAAEVDPRVRRLAPQPITFDLNTGETFAKKSDLKEALHGTRYKPWVYTPDFMFELANGDTVFVEGKHSRWLRSNPAFMQVATAMEQLGHRLVLVTETMFTCAHHRNLRILRALQNRHLTPERRAWIDTQFPPFLSFSEAQKSFGVTGTEICAALCEGLIATDLSFAELGPRTGLYRAHGDLAHLQVLPL